VRPEFATLLEGVSYVTPIIWNGAIDFPAAAIQHAQADGYDRVLPIQTEGNPEPLPEKLRSFSMEPWLRAGYLDQYHVLPPVFDRAQTPPSDWKPRSDKPILAYCLQAYTSPYAEDLKQDLVRWLADNFGDQFSLLELGAAKYRPDSLFHILRQVAVLLTIDTFPLHMAYATGTPTIALTPRGWIASEPRRHWIDNLSYAQSAVAEGRAKIAAALRDVLAGKIQPGKLISTPAATLAHVDRYRQLSILIAALPIHEQYMKMLFDRLAPQLAGHQEVEILCDVDPLPTWEKRMRLLLRAAGVYSCFIDVGDSVAENYVAMITQALRSRPDCVGFKVGWIRSGQIEDVQDATPLGQSVGLAHLCPIKTELLRSIGTGENDEDQFGRKICQAESVESENFVQSVLYFKPAVPKPTSAKK
jgi:hypothetical protein